MAIAVDLEDGINAKNAPMTVANKSLNGGNFGKSFKNLKSTRTITLGINHSIIPAKREKIKIKQRRGDTSGTLSRKEG